MQRTGMAAQQSRHENTLRGLPRMRVIGKTNILEVLKLDIVIAPSQGIGE